LIFTLFSSTLLGSSVNGSFYLQIRHRESVLLLFECISCLIKFFNKQSLISFARIMFKRLLSRSFTGCPNNALPLQAQTTALTSFRIYHVGLSNSCCSRYTSLEAISYINNTMRSRSHSIGSILENGSPGLHLQLICLKMLV
jgi:hypothetical protein